MDLRGGIERVALLDTMLEQMRKNNCEVYVCSKGLVGPVRIVLAGTGLLSNFEDVYGRLEDYSNEQEDEAFAEGGKLFKKFKA